VVIACEVTPIWPDTPGAHVSLFSVFLQKSGFTTKILNFRDLYMAEKKKVSFLGEINSLAAT
jgi:hypothetical protein